MIAQGAGHERGDLRAEGAPHRIARRALVADVGPGVVAVEGEVPSSTCGSW
jgi:hypothetical protein